MTWDITNDNYDTWHIKFNNGVQTYYVPKGRIYMEVAEPYLTLYWNQSEIDPKFNNKLIIDYNDVSTPVASAAALKVLVDGYNVSGMGGGTVDSVTGLNTDNTDPTNPIVQISVDGTTITGDGTPGNPLVSAASGGGYTVVSVASTPYSIVPTSGSTVYLVDASGGSVTMNLPTAVGNTGMYSIKKIDSSLNTVVMDASTTETIDGQLTQTIKFQWTAISLINNNANWFII
jgi:hypothetical protein